VLLLFACAELAVEVAAALLSSAFKFSRTIEEGVFGGDVIAVVATVATDGDGGVDTFKGEDGAGDELTLLPVAGPVFVIVLPGLSGASPSLFSSVAATVDLNALRFGLKLALLLLLLLLWLLGLPLLLLPLPSFSSATAATAAFAAARSWRAVITSRSLSNLCTLAFNTSASCRAFTSPAAASAAASATASAAAERASFFAASTKAAASACTAATRLLASASDALRASRTAALHSSSEATLSLFTVSSTANATASPVAFAAKANSSSTLLRASSDSWAAFFHCSTSERALSAKSLT